MFKLELKINKSTKNAKNTFILIFCLFQNKIKNKAIFYQNLTLKSAAYFKKESALLGHPLLIVSVIYI